ncbi:MAG: hypothetical protein ABSF80_05525 [Chitinispirillaceae bacterium]|jgi:hypothetical protein
MNWMDLANRIDIPDVNCTLSTKEIVDQFDLKIENVEPHDAIISWDTLLLAEDMFRADRDNVLHVLPLRPLNIFGSIIELSNLFESCVLFDHLLVPTRDLHVFRAAYSRNSLLRHLFDEGIIRLISVDSVIRSSLRGELLSVQSEMLNKLTSQNISQDDALLRFATTALYDPFLWNQILFGMEKYGFDWIVEEHLSSISYGCGGGWYESLINNTILVFSMAKLLKTSIQGTVLQYPLHNLLLCDHANYKLPEAYRTLKLKVQAASYGNINNFQNLSIPPITSLVLSKSRNSSSIVANLIKLRNRFASFRKRFKEYQYILDNSNEFTPEQLIKNHEKYYDSFLSDIEKVGPKSSSGFHMVEPVSVTLSYDGILQKFSLSIGIINELMRDGINFLSVKPANVRLLNNLYKAAYHLPRSKNVFKYFSLEYAFDYKFVKFIKKYKEYISKMASKGNPILPSW